MCFFFLFRPPQTTCDNSNSFFSRTDDKTKLWWYKRMRTEEGQWAQRDRKKYKTVGKRIEPSGGRYGASLGNRRTTTTKEKRKKWKENKGINGIEIQNRNGRVGWEGHTKGEEMVDENVRNAEFINKSIEEKAHFVFIQLTWSGVLYFKIFSWKNFVRFIYWDLLWMCETNL